MNSLINLLSSPWPWYIAGPLIGLTVPLLLLLGNKPFGISSSFRHLCAACLPGKISFFKYDWKSEAWNMFFAGGVLIGGFVAATLFAFNDPISINENLRTELTSYGITQIDTLIPKEIFNLANLLTWKGFLLMIIGGFFVGFGTRYAGGCTSGHSIFGISNLQLPSVIATLCFMAGGFFMANIILPIILKK